MNFFGIELERENRIVDFELDGKKFWAIQLKDGSYYNQQWIEETRQFPVWKRKKDCQKQLDKLIATGEIK